MTVRMRTAAVDVVNVWAPEGELGGGSAEVADPAYFVSCWCVSESIDDK